MPEKTILDVCCGSRMFWFDKSDERVIFADTRRSLEEKVARAVDYYRAKYGEQPTVCVVHPHMLPEGVDMTAGVRLLTAKTVQMNHFWLGVDNDAASGGSRAPCRRDGWMTISQLWVYTEFIPLKRC